MKKIYAILAAMVLLFAGTYVAYDYFLANDKALVLENQVDDSSVEVSAGSEESSEEVSAEVAVTSSDSEATDDSAEDEEKSSSAEASLSEEKSEMTASSDTDATVDLETDNWQGPDSNYLNVEGELLALSDNYGKGTLLNIWASWCEPCRVEMPYFDEAYQTYGDDINILMVDALDSRPSETQAAAEDFFEEMALSMPIYFDHEMNNQYLFGATILPLTVILDEEGKVVEIVRGQVSPAKLQQMIEKIL